MTKVGFVSLGCPKNLVDSEVMMGILARSGYELTPRAEEAEVLVVNTCSFIAPAQKESVDTILEMAEYKKFGAVRKLIVAGCLVERYREQILEQIPEVDAVVGTGEVERILDAVEGDLRALPAQPPAFLYHDLTPRLLATPRQTAYIKIAEGCDHPCTFCIIPQLRGGFRSRRFESVVREAENLGRAGAREVTLIGQDTTSYGEDLGLRDGLPLLLEGLAQVPELCWVRFLYCYPNRVTPRLLETIRATVPGITLRTSFIVGFPGETQADLEELCTFVRAAEFDWMGVFCYSDVDNAKSFALDGKLDEEVIHERRDQLMAIQKKISTRKLKARVGQRLPALLEGPSKENEVVWEARLEGMAPEIDGKVYITDIEAPGDSAAAQPGDMVTVEITESHAYDLVARVVEVLDASRRLEEHPAVQGSTPNPLRQIVTGAPLRVLA